MLNLMPQASPSLSDLRLYLASPRGFCAGVDRAIQIVERALLLYGPPVYVRHEIVHNAHVVRRLEALGAVFVDELEDCPDDRPVIVSAHGVPKSVPAEAKQRNLLYFDATCPLVSKVHAEARRHYEKGRKLILVGHAGHPEVIGTMGQLPEGAVVLVETAEDAHRLDIDEDAPLAYITQTTLSVDDTASILAVLKGRFPQLMGPSKEDICYATTNRQDAVKALARHCSFILVIGAPNSSNSQRLVEVALRHGAQQAELIQSAEDIDWTRLAHVRHLGVTAGASAPENLVQEVITRARQHFKVHVEEIRVGEENIVFKLPKALMQDAPCPPKPL